MRLSEHEAVAGVAMLAMYSDGVIAPEEDERLREHLARYALFDGVGEGELGAILLRLAQASETRDGAALLDECCAALREELRPTAFYVAADVVASDGSVALEESAFLAELEARLGLGVEKARAIREVVGIAKRK